MKIYKDLYWLIISPDALFRAWDLFKKNKRNRPDVGDFELNLEQNIFDLYRDLKNGIYKYGPYKGFWIHDPKVRRIHKATVRDRVLHHAIFSVLNPIFEPTFIPNSFSCRTGKGTHKGMKKVAEMIRTVNQNNTKRCYALKCDIRKFFDSIDHNILFGLVSKRIKDENFLSLIKQIICSFKKTDGKGLPLGNVTSQIFSNIYLNELDQYVKHNLKARCYVRYCDDFVIVSDSKIFLDDCLEKIKIFCEKKLLLNLHTHKIIFRKARQGVDFLGYVMLPHRRVLRNRTKNRLLKKLTNLKILLDTGIVKRECIGQIVQSYLGILSHCKSENIIQRIERIFWD